MKQDEYITNLNRIWNENSGLAGFRYFCDLTYEWYQRIWDHSECPRIIVLGTGIPDELVRAFDVSVMRILGGNHESCGWSDQLVPRDTDPITRSILGYLHVPEGMEATDSLILVPLNSDSMRKTAFLLKKEGRNVLTVDFPPVRKNSIYQKRWTRQLDQMMDGIAEHLHRGVSHSTLRQTAKDYQHARRNLADFMEISAAYRECLTDSGRILVENSFYYADDIVEWGWALCELIKEIVQLSRAQGTFRTEQRKPQVLLLGSPVVFPNMKIPDLMRDVGLVMWKNLDATTSMWNSRKSHSPDNLQEIAGAWYEEDGSGAYVINKALRRQVRTIADSGKIDGVIFHILKGQVEPDFEKEYFESYFEAKNIPFFAIETDYQFQDLEQLRIRLEAFREMLSNRILSRKEPAMFANYYGPDKAETRRAI